MSKYLNLIRFSTQQFQNRIILSTLPHLSSIKPLYTPKLPVFDRSSTKLSYCSSANNLLKNHPPFQIDIRVENVAPVKNQGTEPKCGLMAAAALLELIYFRKYQHKITVSTSTLSQASTDVHAQEPWRYLIWAQHHGIPCENGDVLNNVVTSVYEMDLKHWSHIPYYLASPLLMAIKFGSNLEKYCSGLYDGEREVYLERVNGQLRHVHHAMLLVGIKYTGDTNTSYLILQNSWGKSWGIRGFCHYSFPAMFGDINDGRQPLLYVTYGLDMVELPFQAIEKVKELAVSIEGKNEEEKKSLLEKCAHTILSSKLISGEKEFLAKMVVDAVMAVGNDDRLKKIGITKVPGGTMRDSFLVDGVAFKKTFSYAGFEQQPKKILNPKILLLNIELALKSEIEENAEIRLADSSQYQSIVDSDADAEWNIIYDKLEKCVQTGAKIVLSRLAIGNLGTQYFADRDIFCAGRVAEEDMQRVAGATGGTFQALVNNTIDEILGTCEIFEEKQVGTERLTIFRGCPSGHTATIVLRGGDDQVIEEAERSLHDAIMIFTRALMNSTVAAGGGAID